MKLYTTIELDEQDTEVVVDFDYHAGEPTVLIHSIKDNNNSEVVPSRFEMDNIHDLCLDYVSDFSEYCHD